MADPAPSTPRNRNAAVRYFEKPEIALYRMGREVTRLTGEHGSVDLRTATVRVFGGVVTGEGPEIAAARILLNLGGNQVVADGNVRIDDGGVKMSADRVLAPPSLVGIVPVGRVTLLAKDLEAADAVLSTRLL